MYKRFARIYPAYLVGLVLFAGACAWLVGWQPLDKAMVADLLIVQAAIPSLSMAWYGSGAWSVSIEIFFYLFFPLLLPLLLRIKHAQTLRWLLAGVILAGTFGGLSYRFWPQLISYPLMYANPLFRCSEFIAGMMGSILVFKFGWRVKEWQALTAVAVGGTYLAGLAPKLSGFVAHNWMVVPVIVLLLASLVDVNKTKVLRLLALPWVVYAGRVSYCFYLAQLPLFCIQDILLAHRVALPWWSGIAIFIATCFLTAFMHHLIEVPAHRWLMKRRPQQKYSLPISA